LSDGCLPIQIPVSVSFSSAAQASIIAPVPLLNF
jgi:hypothetical protein